MILLEARTMMASILLEPQQPRTVAPLLPSLEVQVGRPINGWVTCYVEPRTIVLLVLLTLAKLQPVLRIRLPTLLEIIVRIWPFVVETVWKSEKLFKLLMRQE